MAFAHADTTTFVRQFSSHTSSTRIVSCHPYVVPSLALSTCRVCKKVFLPSENNSTACRFHPATWTGAERSKFYGRIPESFTPSTEPLQLRGVEYFYDCCNARNHDDPGCCFAFHRTYDE